MKSVQQQMQSSIKITIGTTRDAEVEIAITLYTKNCIACAIKCERFIYASGGGEINSG